MANIFQKIAAATSVIGEVTSTIADAQQLIADVERIQSDPNIRAAIENDPQLGAAVARVSAEIRSVQNDLGEIKNTINTLVH